MPIARRRHCDFRSRARGLGECDVSRVEWPILFRDDHPSSGTGRPLFRARADGSQTRILSRRPGLFSDWRPDGGRIAFDFFQRDGSAAPARVSTRCRRTRLTVGASRSTPPVRTRVRQASRRTCGSCALTGPVRTAWPWRVAGLTRSRGTPRTGAGSHSTGSGRLRAGNCWPRSSSARRGSIAFTH